MHFSLWAALSGLTDPASLLLVLFAVGLALTFTHRQVLGCRLLAAGAACVIAIAVLPLHTWVLAPLEDRFPHPSEPPAHVDGVIVLGGAIDTYLSQQYDMPSMNEAAERVFAFAKLARMFPAARAVFTGGLAPGHEDETPEADMTRQVLADLGIDTSRVIFESASRDTHENVLFSKKLLDPQPGQVWLLVTSAMHMPRSVGIFRQAGWEVVPWPVGYKARDRWDLNFADHLHSLDMAAHEWIGLVTYRLLGRTNALFPGTRGSGG
jgi:uncharacterized SAM-binding protein YcdF (DUF218 family)